MESKTYQKPYCLLCYAPLDPFDGPSSHCPQCDEINLRVDLQKLWTRERRIVDWENSLKLGVALLCGGIGAYILFNPGLGVGRGHGMAIGAPILLAILLWDLASITRRHGNLRGDVVWPIIGGIFALFGIMTSAATFGTRDQADGMLILLVAMLLALPLLLAPLWTRKWKRWRESRVISRQSLAAGGPVSG